MTRLLLPILIYLLLASCAQMQVPHGGPVDKTPPKVLSVKPDSVILSASHFPEITIIFDEYIDHGSFTRALNISPPLFQLHYEWTDFNEIEIGPVAGDSIFSGLVLISIGRELKDLHGNNLNEPIELIVTSYDTLPAGFAKGENFIENVPKSIQVWAVSRGDTLGADALRITEFNHRGKFILKHLESSDNILPVAVLDDGKKYLIDANESIYLPHYSSETESFNFWLPLEKGPGFLPGIEKIVTAKQNHIAWQMENPDNKIDFQIFSSDTILNPLFFYRDLRQPDIYHTWWDSLGLNEITLSWAFVDSSSGSERVVELDEEIDLPKFSFRRENPRFQLLPSDTLLFISSLPINPSMIDHINILPELPFEVLFVNPLEIKIAPENTWPLKTQFDISFHYVPLDSVLKFDFETIHQRDMGKLSGEIPRTTGIDTSIVFIICKDIDRKLTYITSSRNSEFIFPWLREGYYTLHAWKDEDTNGEYFRGTTHPFIAPEPFWFGTDTLKIRKRWENQSSVIIF